MNIHIKSKYLDGLAILKFGKYADQSLAIQATGEYGERLCIPTVCMMDYGDKPAEGEVFIKLYSENQGILECLISEGVVEDTGRRLDAGYVENGVAICKLTQKTLDAIKSQE